MIMIGTTFFFFFNSSIQILCFFTILLQPVKHTEVSVCCHCMLDIKIAKNFKYNWLGWKGLQKIIASNLS